MARLHATGIAGGAEPARRRASPQHAGLA